MNNINGPWLEEGILFKPVNLYEQKLPINSTPGIVLERQNGNNYTTNFTLPGYTEQSADKKTNLYETILEKILVADKYVSENLSSDISKIVKSTMRIWGIAPNNRSIVPKLSYRVRDLSDGTAMEITPGDGEYDVDVSPLMGETSGEQKLYKVAHEWFHAEYDNQGFPISEQNLNVEKTIDNMAAYLLGMPELKETSFYITGEYNLWKQRETEKEALEKTHQYIV
jgi:hypothetical protein